MKLAQPLSNRFLAPVFLVAALPICPQLRAQAKPNASPPQSEQFSAAQDAKAESELQTAIALTRRGLFADAIPHYLAAQGRVSDEYALNFNLALSYLGTAQFRHAIDTLDGLRANGHSDANVENLLSQSYIGNGQPNEAYEALQRAARLTPQNEKLYIFVADACIDHQEYDLGVRVAALGLKNLPTSSRLHYQRAYFLSMLDRFSEANPDFDAAARLAPHTEIAFVAAAQKNLFAGNLPESIRITRAAVQEGRANYLSLTILAEALIRSGATPGQPEFAEAQAALQQAIAAKPNYASAQIELGYALLLDNHAAEAIPHLEKGRELDSQNPSAYSHLAVAYRKVGNTQQAEVMLTKLAQINAQAAAKINSASGETRAIP